MTEVKKCSSYEKGVNYQQKRNFWICLGVKSSHLEPWELHFRYSFARWQIARVWWCIGTPDFLITLVAIHKNSAINSMPQGMNWQKKISDLYLLIAVVFYFIQSKMLWLSKTVLIILCFMIFITLSRKMHLITIYTIHILHIPIADKYPWNMLIKWKQYKNFYCFPTIWYQQRREDSPFYKVDSVITMKQEEILIHVIFEVLCRWICLLGVIVCVFVSLHFLKRRFGPRNKSCGPWLQLLKRERAEWRFFKRK